MSKERYVLIDGTDITDWPLEKKLEKLLELYKSFSTSATDDIPLKDKLAEIKRGIMLIASTRK